MMIAGTTFLNYVGLMVLSANPARQLQRHGTKVVVGWYVPYVVIKHRLLLEHCSTKPINRLELGFLLYGLLRAKRMESVHLG
jgi:hypothetical protein